MKLSSKKHSMIFDAFEDIYKHLESINLDEEIWELSSDIKRLYDKENDEHKKKKLKWEYLAFDFRLLNGEANPMHSSAKEDGTSIFEYPSYKDFGDEGLDYLKSRINEISNSFLFIRYNQILWNSPKPHKHHQYAKNAIDGYLNLLSNLKVNEKKKSKRNIIELMRNVLSISLQAKYKIDESKAILRSWLFDKGKFDDTYKIFLLEYMLDTPQLKSEDFDNCAELINKIAVRRRRNKPDYFVSKTIYETGLRVAQRTKQNTKVWNKRIGDSLIRMANYRLNDETRMIPLSFLKEAIPYYKEAGLPKKVRETEQKYFELKKELKLSKIELPLNDEASEALHQYLENKVTNLMKADIEDIFGYILTGDDIFPKKQWLTEMAKDRSNSFLDFVTNLKFDINNNVSKHKETKTQLAKAKIYENYGFYMQLSVLNWLHRIFLEGIKCGKITFVKLARFISDKTWFGQEITVYDASGDPMKYKWISIIAPPLHEYFIQMESALKSSNPYTNFIMPIDSLTLKFEGALRDFASVLNISTTVTGKGNVLREKYIEELLSEKAIEKLFDEDDLLLFNYLFVSKDGMNLRNNIAHCFYRSNDYSFQIMHLLICAFLRLGKYRLKTRS